MKGGGHKRMRECRREEQVCKKCEGELLHMRREGEMVCIGCGLVNDMYMIADEVAVEGEMEVWKEEDDWTKVVSGNEEGVKVEEAWKKYGARTKGEKAALTSLETKKDGKEICEAMGITERMFKEGMNKMKKEYKQKKLKRKEEIKRRCEGIMRKLEEEGVKMEKMSKEMLRSGKRMTSQHSMKVISAGLVASKVGKVKQVALAAKVSESAVRMAMKTLTQMNN